MSQNAHKLLETANETVTAQIAATLPAGEDVLILDEATASVDVETEHQIQAALSHLVEGRTTFAIARSALHPAQRETLAHGVGGGVVENGFVLDQAMSNVQASQQVEVALAEAF